MNINPKKKCSVEGCVRKYRAFGYCFTHLRRLRKYGKVFKSITPEKGKRILHTFIIKKCSVVGCGRIHRAKGFCSCHYIRFKKFGTPQENIPIKEIKRVQKFCKFCNSPIYRGKTYCSYDCKQEAKEEFKKNVKYNLPYFKNGGKQKEKIEYKPQTHFMHKYLAVQLVVLDNTFKSFRRRFK